MPRNSATAVQSTSYHALSPLYINGDHVQEKCMNISDFNLLVNIIKTEMTKT